MEKGDETAKTSISGIEREFVNYPIVKIKLSDIVSYSKHPFKVCEDDKLHNDMSFVDKIAELVSYEEEWS